MSADARLRIHPKERLAGAVQHIDLAEAAATLRAELHEATHGHRQIAIVKHGAVSILLFVFDRGGMLKEHRTNGEVTIQVLAGELEVMLESGAAIVGPGELVSLAAGQAHSVRAIDVSEMLLTICQRTGEAPTVPST